MYLKGTDTTTTTNNSLQHQAAWGQHSYARSSSNLIYLKPPSLHPPRKFPFQGEGGWARSNHIWLLERTVELSSPIEWVPSNLYSHTFHMKCLWRNIAQTLPSFWLLNIVLNNANLHYSRPLGDGLSLEAYLLNLSAISLDRISLEVTTRGPIPK